MLPLRIRAIELAGLVALIALIAGPIDAYAQVNKFLCVEGIMGDATDSEHLGCSNVVGYRQVIKAPGARAFPCRAVVTKEVDGASPKYWQMTARGFPIEEAVIEVEDRRCPGVVSVVSILTDARILRVDNAEGTGSDPLSNLEALTLEPREILLRIRNLGADCSLRGTTEAQVDCEVDRDRGAP